MKSLSSSGYAAYLFDLDGTLADTRDWIRDAYLHTASRFGFEAPDSALNAVFGLPLRACYERLRPGLDPTVLMECHWERQRETMELQKLYPGVHETLSEIRSRGGLIAIISSRTGPSQRETLRLFDMERRIDGAIWPEDCVAHKPDPEPVFKALALFGVDPADALVIGDASNDIRAGRSAGTETAGAAYGFVGEEIAKERPTYVLREIRGVLELPRR